MFLLISCLVSVCSIGGLFFWLHDFVVGSLGFPCCFTLHLELRFGLLILRVTIQDEKVSE